MHWKKKSLPPLFNADLACISHTWTINPSPCSKINIYLTESSPSMKFNVISGKSDLCITFCLHFLFFYDFTELGKMMNCLHKDSWRERKEKVAQIFFISGPRLQFWHASRCQYNVLYIWLLLFACCDKKSSPRLRIIFQAIFFHQTLKGTNINMYIFKTIHQNKGLLWWMYSTAWNTYMFQIHLTNCSFLWNFTLLNK